MKIATAALLLLALLTPTASHAGQPARGTVVAVTDEVLVIATDRGGRRLFVLDGAPAPEGLRAGDRVAIDFTVGEDNHLHAVGVGRGSAGEAPASAPLPAGLVALVAAAALGPAGLALAPLFAG